MQQVTLDRARRAALGQFLTPPAIASRMAACFTSFGDDVRLLDAGAGAGALVEAAAAAAHGAGARRILATAYEIDPIVTPRLERTLAALAATLPGFSGTVRRDFLAATEAGFTHAILNPPYRKLRADSEERRLLGAFGIETTNLYAAFVALAIRRLAPGGELVAITPRSFCNGPYFRSFRRLLLAETCLRSITALESRTQFDDALQENVIIHLVKGAPQGDVVVGARTMSFGAVVRPRDEEQFIHLVTDAEDDGLAAQLEALPCTLDDLGLGVSTGKVVAFRAREWLRSEPEPGAGPLVHPTHLAAGGVVWPRTGKKPNALVDCADTAHLWMPPGTYVLVKRVTSKEEARRVVAAVHDAGVKTAFENHLDVFHARGCGIAPALALGLRRYLDSTAIDRYFRQFNGHTQVNATDLRRLRYPSRQTLAALGRHGGSSDEALRDAIGLTVSSRASALPTGSSSGPAAEFYEFAKRTGG